MAYTLTVNGQKSVWGTFKESASAVVQLVTTRLGAEPERVAEEAGTLNQAFNSGEVERAVEEHGDWFTVFDAYGEEPLRIRITKEDS